MTNYYIEDFGVKSEILPLYRQIIDVSESDMYFVKLIT